MALIADFVTGKPVSFRRVRHLLAQMGLQEGVVGAGDLKVAQRAAGANWSVDVAIGEAWVAVETGVRNGVAHLTNDAVANVAVPQSDATNPTVHSVVAQYNDTAIPAGAGGDDPTFRLIAGTPTAGATLDNRSGAPAMPADAILLADVLVPAASTSVINANIRDRRRWARGLHANGSHTVSHSLAAGANIPAGLALRVELSGATVVANFEGRLDNSNTGGSATVDIEIQSDGNRVGPVQRWRAPVATYDDSFALAWRFTPGPASRVLRPALYLVTGSNVALRGDLQQSRFVASEDLRQLATNA